MYCTIKNLVGRPVLLRLNSGQTRHLDANGELSEVLGVDIKDNVGLTRLSAKGVILISEAGEAKNDKSGSSGKDAQASGKKKNP